MIPSNFSNISDNVAFGFPPPPPFRNKVPFTVAYSILFIASFIGNTLIIWFVHKDRRLKNTTNFLVTNMAVSDLISTLFGIPLQIAHINFNRRWPVGGQIGNALCKMTPFAGEVSATVSFYSCVFIAIDRYNAVANPLRPLQLKIRYILVVMWILSCLLKSPYLYFFSILKQHEFNYCLTLSKVFSKFVKFRNASLSISAGFPAITVTIIYVLIVYKLYTRKVPGESIDRTAKRRRRQNKNVLKMSVAIVVLLYQSYGLHFIISVLFSQGKLNNLSPSSLDDLMSATFFMLHASLAYNFFIYLKFNNIYRENVKILLAKCCLRRRFAGSKKDGSIGNTVNSAESIIDTTSSEAVKLQSIRAFVISENNIGYN